MIAAFRLACCRIVLAHACTQNPLPQPPDVTIRPCLPKMQRAFNHEVMTHMLHIPILRHGKPYESVDKIQIVHHATGEPVAQVSMANSGLISRDVHRMDDGVLEQFTVGELVAMCKKAADIFLNGSIRIGDTEQTFDQYVVHLSATTGMPHGYCRSNARKIHRVLDEMC